MPAEHGNRPPARRFAVARRFLPAGEPPGRLRALRLGEESADRGTKTLPSTSGSAPAQDRSSRRGPGNGGPDRGGASRAASRSGSEDVALACDPRGGGGAPGHHRDRGPVPPPTFADPGAEGPERPDRGSGRAAAVGSGRPAGHAPSPTSLPDPLSGLLSRRENPGVGGD